MNLTGAIRLKAVEYKQDEGGGAQRYVVTFMTWGSGAATAEIAIGIPLAEGITETELVKEAGARCHRLLNQLAGETKGWDPQQA